MLANSYHCENRLDKNKASEKSMETAETWCRLMKPDVCFLCFHREMKNYRFVWQAAGWTIFVTWVVNVKHNEMCYEMPFRIIVSFVLDDMGQRRAFGSFWLLKYSGCVAGLYCIWLSCFTVVFRESDTFLHKLKTNPKFVWQWNAQKGGIS